MKVFISWSGEKSRAVAELLNTWLKCVIQACRPWVSTHNIDSGSVWFGEISKTLSEVSEGIICLTKDNKNNPWILFEAGALAKGLCDNRVFIFLIDLTATEVNPPLSQFNLTEPTKESVKNLLISINNRLDEKLDIDTLNTVFNTYWNQFEDGISKILKRYKAEKIEQVNEDELNNEILKEILYSVRNINHRVRNLEFERKDYFEKNNFAYIDNDNISCKVRDLLGKGIPASEIVKIIGKYYDIPKNLAVDIIENEKKYL